LEELHTCIGVGVEHLRKLGAAKCLVLGAQALREMFSQEGLAVVDASDVDAVVVGLDTGLTYDRLQLACDAIHTHGASLVALHRNRLLVDEAGRCSPSVGAVVEAISYATQVQPTVIGKPSPTYFQEALTALGLSPESVLVVSDDPYSDLAGAKRLGMWAALVLSGKYPDAAVVETLRASERPDFVADTVYELLTSGFLEL
jgi:HAD superfamily hydrolase (TIGR01450 family)